MFSKNFLLFFTSTVLLACSFHQAAGQKPGCSLYVSDKVGCSGPVDIYQMQNYFTQLSQNVTLKLTELSIGNNPAIQRLPVGLLGNLRFDKIEIIGCPNLVQVDDFLGASSESLMVLNMYYNSLSEMPQLTARKLGMLHVDQPGKQFVVRRTAFRQMKDIWRLELGNVLVEPFAFIDSKKLAVLKIHNLSPEPLAAGTFNFDSPALGYVELTSYDSWEGHAEPGTFGGFLNTTWFRLGAAAKVSPDIFFPVLSSSTLFEIGRPVRCDCQVAWIRLSTFLPRTTIRCGNETSYVSLQEVDEAEFKDCGAICSA
ncbi:uncharacterized protein LOC122263384 [Penaeus japonicus]|uniref:uncharacterized protein LOC122263384 n=1 Tax=Penaeus japonicus TaxID=27405 RepID=UPI001C7133AF|nr:uncharacterized protein LOC122263384 [Penaeus japonicus]